MVTVQIRQHIRTSHPPRSECGMVTAEIALGLAAVVMIMAAIGFGLGLLNQQVRVAEVAAEVARQVAREDSEAADLAKQRAPDKGRSRGHHPRCIGGGAGVSALGSLPGCS